MTTFNRTLAGEAPALRSELLSDQVYTLLRRAIIAGDLQPGDRIVESEVARELGVSQAPVREAVKRLVHGGLVTHVPRRGSHVTRISDEEAVQARQVRTSLEELAARCAATSASDAMLKAMALDVDAMRAAARADDPAAFRSYDIDFHRKVCEASGNTFLVRMWSVLEPSLRSLRAISDPFYLGDYTAMAEEHARLLELLRAGDGEEAAAAFALHAGGQPSILDGKRHDPRITTG